MTAVKHHHLARLRQLRDELYSKLPPQEQRLVDEARKARQAQRQWLTRQRELALFHQ
jgi:hypothetical protein